MNISPFIVIAIVAVLAGSLLLAISFSGTSLFPTVQHGSQIQEAQAAVLPLAIVEKFQSKDMAGDAANGTNLKVDDDFVDPENQCEFCTRVEYNPSSEGLAGFSYKSPVGLDFTGAKKVSLWVMGQNGGEKVQFDVAGKSVDKDQSKEANKLAMGIFKNEKFALKTHQVTLSKDWKKLDIDLKNADLRGITHPFGIEIFKGTNNANKQVVFVKGITYDTQPPENPLASMQENTTNLITVKIISNSTEGVVLPVLDFKANVSGGTGPYNITWNFDDGTTGSGQHITHTFIKSGDYKITLSVKDANGQNVSENQLIHITKTTTGAPAQKQHLNDLASHSVNSSNATSTSINRNSSSNIETNSSKILEKPK